MRRVPPAVLLAVLAGCGGSDPADLATGDCFTTADTGLLSEFAEVDCTLAREGGEVAGGVGLSAYEVIGGAVRPDGETLPAQDDLDDFAQQECPEGFTQYLAPTEKTWARGDRTVECLLEHT